MYGWGYNEQGQLGVPKIMGVEYVHDEITAPTKVDEANLKGKNIVDFDLGQDISVILTGIKFKLVNILYNKKSIRLQ